MAGHSVVALPPVGPIQSARGSTRRTGAGDSASRPSGSHSDRQVRRRIGSPNQYPVAMFSSFGLDHGCFLVPASQLNYRAPHARVNARRPARRTMDQTVLPHIQQGQSRNLLNQAHKQVSVSDDSQLREWHFSTRYWRAAVPTVIGSVCSQRLRFCFNCRRALRRCAQSSRSLCKEVHAERPLPDFGNQGRHGRKN